MKLTVCTGWSPTGWDEYGRRFFETFDRYWDPAVDLVIYGEEPRELHSLRGRSIEFRQLLDIHGMQAFFDTYRPHPQFNGRKVDTWWKEKNRLAGYNFRFDAVKFSRQGFIPEHAAAQLDPGEDPQFLAWLDGDVITHAPVPLDAFVGLLPEGFDVAYLGRGAKHSEIGFQLYRLNAGTAPAFNDCRAMLMLEEFSRMYRSGEVFNLKEWHSAFVWDHCRVKTGVKAHDLTPGGTGHVWHQSPLRAWLDHLKGGRKAAGRSPERR